MITIDGFIEKYSDDFYFGHIPKIKGLFAEGESIEEVKNELVTLLKVKITFDYKLDVKKIESKEIKSNEDLPILRGSNENEFKFELPLC
jgi:predicted RNase H-like HicB family nuclease